MHETFELRRLENGIIRGYQWKTEDPEKVICIVHGIGEYGGRYDRVASHFNDAGFAVVSMDLRGHGDSIGKKGHCAPREAVLDDISEMLRYAQKTWPGKKIVLYGHSMGGNITLDYKSRGELNDVPCAYLITGPWIRLVRPIPPAFLRLVKAAAKLMPSFTIGSDVDEAILGHPEVVLPYHDDPMVHNRISLQCALDGYEIGKKLEEGTLENNGKADDIPLLLMHGQEDRICDIQGTLAVAVRMKQKDQPVEFISWPGLFHEIHNGGKTSKGDEVIDMMIRYFRNV